MLRSLWNRIAAYYSEIISYYFREKPDIDRMVLQMRAITGSSMNDHEIYMDALARSNRLYTFGVDQRKFDKLIEDLAMGRISLESRTEADANR